MEDVPDYVLRCESCGFEPEGEDDDGSIESLVNDERDGWKCPECGHVSGF